MANDLFEGPFQPKFAKKRLKMTILNYTKVLTPVKVSELK